MLPEGSQLEVILYGNIISGRTTSLNKAALQGNLYQISEQSTIYSKRKKTTVKWSTVVKFSPRTTDKKAILAYIGRFIVCFKSPVHSQ